MRYGIHIGNKIVLYFFVLFAMLNCGSVYSGNTINICCQVLLLLLFVFSLGNILQIPDRVYLTIIIFVLILFFYIALFLFLNYLNSPFSILKYVFLLFIDPVIMVIYFLSQINDYTYDNVFYVFENVAIILSVISLFFWILALINVPTNMSKIISWGGIRVIPGYFGLDFIPQRQIQFLGMNLIRNTGIFDEAPMYNYVLCIALLVELFIRKHTCKWKAVILFITIISTTSTTGLFVAIPAIIYKLFISSHRYSFKILILILIPMLFLGMYILIQDKIGDASNQLSSYNIRHYDIISCISAWRQRLFIGNGLSNVSSIAKYGRMIFVNGEPTLSSGGSNGFFMVLALGGIMYSLFFIIPTALFSIRSLRTFAIALFTFILLIYTIIYDSIICTMLLSYFWSYLLYSLKIKLT